MTVCAESIEPEEVQNMESVFHPKSAEERAHLQAVVQGVFLFKQLSDTELSVVIDAIFRCEVTSGTEVISQGDDGDNFYVVQSGVFTALVQGSPVLEYNNEGCFGELALMYNCPRAASVVCKTDGVLWGLDRMTFRRIMLRHAQEKATMYQTFLQSTPLLRYLSREEQSKLVDALENVFFNDGDEIIRQGDMADSFYFVQSGLVSVCARDVPGGRQLLSPRSA